MRAGTSMRLLWQVLVWGGYGALTLALFVRNAGLASGMVWIAAVLALGLLLASEALRALVLRRQWLQGSPWRLIGHLLWLVVVLAALVQVAIYLALASALNLGWASLPGGLAGYTPAAVFLYWFNTAIVLGLWTAIWVGVAALAQSRRNELARLRAESERRALELEALRARLNPHFVFNALNNVRALINEDAGRARELVTRLSNTLRHALVHSQQAQVRLAEEWAVIQDYLAVEAVQFERRLQVDAWMDPVLADCELPPMLLQLLVENAIKHGIARTPGGGTLRILAERVGERVRLRVDNPGHLVGRSQSPSGVAADPPAATKAGANRGLDQGDAEGAGIGLAWLRSQLERLQATPQFRLYAPEAGIVRAELEWQP